VTVESEFFAVTISTGDQGSPAWANYVRDLHLDKRITAAETAAGVTPTHYQYRPGDIRRYGAVGDGSTSDYTAWVNAALVGGKITVPENFNSAIASASLGSAGIDLLSNTTIEGVDRGTSKITITGATACNLFTAEDVSCITIRRLGLYGNSVAAATEIGMALLGRLTSGAAASHHDICVEDCYLQNFKGDYWIYYTNNSTNRHFTTLKVLRNRFQSMTGNARVPGAIGAPSSCFGLFGGDLSSATAFTRDVQIKDNWADCGYLHQFVNIWSNVDGFEISGNDAKDGGRNDGAFVVDTGNYAVTVYQQNSAGGSDPPRRGRIHHNKFRNFLDVGVYAQRAWDLEVDHNHFEDITSTADGTLIKGGVAFNGGNRCRSHHNKMVNCYIGVSMLADDAYASNHSSIDDEVISNVTAARGLRLTSINTSNLGRLIVRGAEVELTGTGSTHGVLCDIDTNVDLEYLEISDSFFDSAFNGIVGSDASSITNLVLNGNTIRGCSNVGLEWQGVTTLFVIKNMTFAGGWGAAAFMMDVSSCTNLAISGVTFCNMTSGTGTALAAGGAAGVMEGVQYLNVSASFRVLATGGNDFGREAPTASRVAGDYVQNLLAADDDTDEMILIGWRNFGTTNWHPNYVSTVTPAS
jgi:hypothetical protein